MKRLDFIRNCEYVDLKDLGVGTHEIPVNVTGSDLRVKYSSETTKITLKIIEN